MIFNRFSALVVLLGGFLAVRAILNRYPVPKKGNTEDHSKWISARILAYTIIAVQILYIGVVLLRLFEYMGQEKIIFLIIGFALLGLYALILLRKSRG